MLPGAKIFAHINQLDNPNQVVYINIHQIESVAVQLDGNIRIQMNTGTIYTSNEQIHKFMERIQFA